ncbi:MFS transporter, SP family, sugar:H+ symporter, partial [Candida albicans 12C]
MSQDNVSSTSTAEAVNNEIKVKDEFPQEEQAHTSLEDKPVSAYIGIIIMCFLIAFGGFVFGFDTGTISGFINMSDFLERFGGTKADGTLYFSNVRTGLMIGLFNAGCAIGALFLSKVGDMYGRRVGIMTAMIVYIVGIIVQIASQHAWYQ